MQFDIIVNSNSTRWSEHTCIISDASFIETGTHEHCNTNLSNFIFLKKQNSFTQRKRWPTLVALLMLFFLMSDLINTVILVNAQCSPQDICFRELYQFLTQRSLHPKGWRQKTFYSRPFVTDLVGSAVDLIAVNMEIMVGKSYSSGIVKTVSFFLLLLLIKHSD